MPRFQHTISLHAVPRDWFEDAVVVLHDALATALPLDPTIELVKGEHCAPGAEYRSTDGSGTVVITAWDLGTETSARFTADDGDLSTTLTAVLHSAERPRGARVEGAIRSGAHQRFRSLRQLSYAAEIDLDRWWQQLARSGGVGKAGAGKGGVPVSGWVRHRLGVAHCAVSARDGGDGLWTVRVELNVRGRGVTRIPAAIGLRLFRRPITKGIENSLAEMATDWAEEIPALIRKTGRELERAMVDELLSPADEKPGDPEPEPAP